MIRKFTLTLMLISFMMSGLYAQDYWYLVKLADKNNSPYSLENPEEFLSQRSLDRRSNAGISLYTSDLPVTPQYIQDVESLDVNVHNKLKWINSLIVTSDEDKMSELEALDFVASVSTLSTPSWAASQNKAFFDNEKHQIELVAEKNSLEASAIDYGFAENQIKMMNGHVLHDAGYTGDGLVIAVLDAGFKETDQIDVFQPLFNNGQILSTRDVIRPQESVYSSSSHYHGTAVLSTMAANIPGTMVGTAPDAQYHLIVTEDQYAENLIEEYWWIDGAEYADSVGADIINSSLGYSTFDASADNHTYDDMNGETTPITLAADMAMDKGILVVTSAGNSGGSSWYYVTAPADGKKAFTIGAVDGNGNSASFSSHGPTADGRIKPDIVAQGQGTAYVFPDGAGGSISNGNGTSFSSPIIAGMSACFWQANPEMTNFEVKQNIILASDKLETPGPDYGHGLPDFNKAMNSLIARQIKGSDKTFIIYPNPVTEDDQLKVNYRGSQSVHGSLTIYTQEGRQVETKEVSFSTGEVEVLDIKLKSGIYFLSFTSEAINERMRFIVL